MITITIKGLSKEAHQALKKRAVTHGRSLNTEAIAGAGIQRPQPAGGGRGSHPEGAPIPQFAQVQSHGGGFEAV